MTLWCVFRSPLIFGGNLPETDAVTLSLITNGEALAVNQHGRGPRELRATKDQVVWTSDLPQAHAKIAALFNISDGGNSDVRIAFSDLGLPDGRYLVRDLWKKIDIGTFSGSFSATLPPHGAGLFKISAPETNTK